MIPALEITGLNFAYESRRVLDDVSFQVGPGESVGLVGANGSGKSTLLWCVMGLLRCAGTVRIFGGPAGKAARHRAGMVFQNPEDQLFMPTLTQDLSLPLMNAGMPPAEARLAAAATLAQAGLEDCADRPATQLSLGQRKRAAIAQALARHPDLLILDEPTAELDGRSVRLLAEALCATPAAKLIASHHLEFLRLTASRLVVLSNGKVLAEGPTPAMLDNRDLLFGAGLI